MSSKLASTTLVVSALAIACQPAAQSPADTTVTTSSSTVQTVGGGSSIDTNAATSGVAGKSAPGAKTTKSVSPITGKSGTQMKSPPVDDPTIRGRDSVIRGFPMKGLPTASSSPIRK